MKAVDMKVVNKDRLTVGSSKIPEGCYLTPCLQPIIGDLVWNAECGEVVEIKAHGSYWRNLYWVIEPIPEKPKKLGRLPKVGERFWIEVECLETGYEKFGKQYPVIGRSGPSDDDTFLIHESMLGINISKKHTELAELRKRVAELEKELGGD